MTGADRKLSWSGVATGFLAAVGLVVLAACGGGGVAPAAPAIPLGGTQQFTATGSYSDGSTQNLTTTATWSSSNTAVATIAAGGLATSAGAGSATISAASGTVTGSTTLTVTAAVQGDRPLFRPVDA